MTSEVKTVDKANFLEITVFKLLFTSRQNWNFSYLYYLQYVK